MTEYFYSIQKIDILRITPYRIHQILGGKVINIDNTEETRVALFQRYEFKYILPEKTASLIEAEINNFMTKDSHVVNNLDYYVRSQYFENNLYSNFYEKVDGMRVRHKYRIRTYSKTKSNSSPIFLEMKSRILERTFKSRIELKKDHQDLAEKTAREKHRSTRHLED